MCYKSLKKHCCRAFALLIVAGGLTLNVSSAEALNGGAASVPQYTPLIFSFFVNPITSSHTLSPHGENQETTQIPSHNTGVMVNTVVQSVGLKGGLSYFSGKGSPASSLGNFGAIYSFNGWNTFESILVVPNTLSSVSSSLSLGNDSTDNHLQAVSLYGGYDLTPSLKIKGAFLISKSPVNVESTDTVAFSNSSYSWWLDFGGDYKLNEKMTYTVNFGYYDSDEVVYDSGGKEMIQGSVYLFNNQLNMSF